MAQHAKFNYLSNQIKSAYTTEDSIWGGVIAWKKY